VILLVILTILLQGFVIGCFTYCGVKIYKLPHFPSRWGLYLSTPYFAIAAYLFVLLATAPFTPRAVFVVLWAVIARFVALILLAAGVAISTFFFFGWINGASAYHPKNSEDSQ
jgi:hypothetical protein